MTIAFEDSPARAAARPGRKIATVAAIGGLLIFTTILRFTIGSGGQLWIDEVYTGMIVSQPSLGDFVHQCLNDVDAPLYSVLAGLWAQLSGVSDRALRFLPATFGSLAPMIALLPGIRIGRATRLTWCVLLACWIPGIWYSDQARWYTLAFLLAAANAVAFAGLLQSPTQRRAWLWASLSSALCLTHYYGVVLVAMQGMIYLAVHKRVAARTWPAAIAFAPVLASIAVDVSHLMALATPQTTWIGLLRPIDLFFLSGFIIGRDFMTIPLLAWAIPGVVFQFRSSRNVAKGGFESMNYLWLVASCSFAAVLLSIAVGFFLHTLTDRYLISFEPGILLGISVLAVHFSKNWRASVGVLLAIYLVFLAIWTRSVLIYRDPERYQIETAYRVLGAAHPNRLVFLWDNLMQGDRTALIGLGGFLFRRAGQPVTVDPIYVAPGQDPNPVLIARAQQDGSAILWFYDLGIRGTNARRFRPRLAQIDPRWRCGNFGNMHVGIEACYRQASANTSGLTHDRRPVQKNLRE